MSTLQWLMPHTLDPGCLGTALQAWSCATRAAATACPWLGRHCLHLQTNSLAMVPGEDDSGAWQRYMCGVSVSVIVALHPT